MLLRIILLAIAAFSAQAKEDYAAPYFSVEDTTLYLPYIRTENSGTWMAVLECDSEVKTCNVVRTLQICKPGITNFSPSVCLAE